MSPSETVNLDFEQLTPYQPRQFVPKDVDLTNAGVVTGLCQQLLDRSIASSEELNQWVLDRSELEAALDQQGTILYIRMTCQTDDKSRTELYKNFIETVVPAVKPLDDQLNHKYVKALKSYPLDQDRYHVYTREIQADIDLFVQENVDLETKVSLLSQEYQSVCGAMTVQFQGKELTMPQMSKFLLDPDCSLREQAYRGMTSRRLQDKQKLEDIFDQMLKLRNTIAKNAKCKNFCDYIFRDLHRFDYTPEDCKQYHDTAQKQILPLWKKIVARREEKMKVDSLRPWDTAVDPLGREPLKPFEKVDQLIKRCQDIFKKVDPELGAQFTDMAERGLLDLASRKGKAPGGYQSALDEARKPFIFMNAVGTDGDVRTLLHEAGHAFHAVAAADDPLVDYRHGPMEFNEVASMAMELFGGEHLDAFYKPDDENRSKEDHLEDIVYVLLWVATIDAFQHWIYENPDHTPEERKKYWLEVHNRFGGDLVDWRELDEEHEYLWHRQLHIFEVPFYYIEYGIAQIGALQLWLNTKDHWENAVRDYRHALSLGGSRPLPQLYEAAGIRFDFSEKTIAPLMEAIANELKL